jgi:hypothetical protein
MNVPLPEQIHAQLRAEAERTQVPATTLAREAIDSWLQDQARKARHDAIAAYAAGMAGTDLDLDPDLGNYLLDAQSKTLVVVCQIYNCPK